MRAFSRLCVVVALATLGLGFLPAAGVDAIVPVCEGNPATIVAQGGGVVNGTKGDDVIVMVDFENSPTKINGLGGNDYICASGFEVTIDGGGGNDRITAPNCDCVADGGPGYDYLYVAGTGRGGSGDDDVHAFGRAEGGSGSDIVEAFQGAVADGGSGNDTVLGSPGSKLIGGSGSDTLVNQAGPTPQDGGAGYDTCVTMGATNVQRCENVS
jgi:Ca2+-binding RTX toxin-like protein